MTAQKFIQIEKVEKSFGGLKALDQVSFDIDEGEIVALVGDNGAGKSTLIKVIAGAHPCDAGRIRVDGEEVNFHSPRDAASKGIGTLFQTLGLVNSLNVFENIFLGNELVKKLGPFELLDKSQMRKRTIELLNEFSVDIPTLDKPVEKLSGGQRQSVAISRLLLEEMRLIIMDEPMAALGVAEGNRVLNLIQRMRENRVSVLVISHNLEHVFSIADRIVVLKNGRLVGVANTSKVSQSDVVGMITTGVAPEVLN